MKVFTLYEHDSHLGHVTITICINFGLPIIRSLHMNFEFNWPSGFGKKIEYFDGTLI